MKNLTMILVAMVGFSVQAEDLCEPQIKAHVGVMLSNARVTWLEPQIQSDAITMAEKLAPTYAAYAVRKIHSGAVMSFAVSADLSDELGTERTLLLALTDTNCKVLDLLKVETTNLIR